MKESVPKSRQSLSDPPSEQLEVVHIKRGRVPLELLMAFTVLRHPATLDEIWKTPPLDRRHRVTVYKLLKRFEALGVVRRLHLQGQRHKFELVPACGLADYILCLQCQLLSDLGQTNVRHLKAVCEEQNPGWKIVRHELKFYGICPACQSPSSPSFSVQSGKFQDNPKGSGSMLNWQEIVVETER